MEIAMEIDHPLLFVGLGGTGGKIGLELQRRLRAEVRGPDGMRRFGTGDGGHLRYELPSCFQFVYVDIDDNDLQRLKDQVPGHREAVGRNMYIASKLLPSHRSFAEVAQYLRIRSPEEVRGWLPPADGQPKVAPLSAGAGQLPTVGRACLFARMAEAGIAAAQDPITDAIEKIRRCAVDLAALGGLNPSSCDVFVAFSVAGGTGNGMFYDYIHLIADAFQHTGIAIQIYPLVVMPSAFADGNGGGRNAELNAGRGLLDLSRLIDDQNMRDANVAFRPDEAEREKGLSVSYRDGKAVKRIQIAPSTAQTAFLFARTAALTPAELHGSIVSFILSIAGIRSAASAADGHNTAAQSRFINDGVDRQASAPSGIGGRGMSTAAVALLSVPRTEILRLFAARLLAEVIAKLEQPMPGENNEPLLDTFFTATKLTDLEVCPALDAHGAEQLRSPRSRGLAARTEIEGHKQLVLQRVYEMAHGFEPEKGLAAIAREGADPFRAMRAISGQGSQFETGSVSRFLRRSPALLTTANLPSRPSQQETRAWLEANVKAIWVAEWAAQFPVWDPKLARMVNTLHVLSGSLLNFCAESDKRFNWEVTGLFTDHATVRHFLHDLPRDARDFYQRLATQLAESLGLGESVTDAERILPALTGKSRPWEDVILEALNSRIGPHLAVARFHTLISERILSRTDSDDRLLPHLADLIVPNDSASRDLAGSDAIQSAVRGLVPTGLLMKATGPAKVLVTYPVRRTGGSTAPTTDSLPTGDTASGPELSNGGQLRGNDAVEGFLKQTIDLGSQPGAVHYEFRPTAEETLTVVTMRTALGVTDIPEARKVMSLWSSALRTGDVEDSLRWRQRLGYDYGWLLTTEEQRVNILQRLLIAMRNDWVMVLTGDEIRPLRIAIRAGDESGSGAAHLEIPLRTWDDDSPWADLLHAYEESILAGDELNRQEMYRSLMGVMPKRNSDDGQVTKPASVYTAFLKVRDEEIPRLESVLQRDPPHSADHRLQVMGLRDFWKDTVREAMNKPIPGHQGRRNTLAALDIR
jgi:Tubulin like